MVVDTGELMRAISIIADERNVRVTMKQTGKGAVVCGLGSFVGGLLLGPVGLAVGGAAGGIAAYRMTTGTFRPLGEVLINDLTDTQKEMLVEHVSNVARSFEINDLATLLPLLLTSSSIQEAVLSTTLKFITTELNMQLLQ